MNAAPGRQLQVVELGTELIDPLGQIAHVESAFTEQGIVRYVKGLPHWRQRCA